jgi:DNA-binding MarR family transcriptional regulator
MVNVAKVKTSRVSYSKQVSRYKDLAAEYHSSLSDLEQKELELRDTLTAHHQKISDILATLSVKDKVLTVQQWAVLRAIYAVRTEFKSPDTISGTVKILGPSLSRILTTLEEYELIRIQPDPRDFRRKQLTTTYKGGRLVNRGMRLFDNSK